MKQSEARKVLGLSPALPDLTEEIITEAFRRAVKINHPDTASIVMGTAPNIGQMVEAKEFLLNSISGADFACKLCKGTGKVPAKMGLRSCVACNGTGDRR